MIEKRARERRVRNFSNYITFLQFVPQVRKPRWVLISIMSESKNLTTGSVSQNLIRLVLPMIFGIVAVLSVSLVDTYFVGRLGTDPLAALSFTFPVTLTISSLAIGLGAGAASLVSRSVGAQDQEDAKRMATDSLILAIALVAAISILGFFTIRPLFSLLGAQGEILNMIERYMRIWYISMPFLVVPMVANAIIRAVGDALWPSAIMIGAAFVNIATTPMFIFGFGIIPALDIEGAAWGTLVARVTTLIFASYILVFREKLVVLAFESFEDTLKSWWRVVKIAVPAAIGSAANPIGIAVVTSIVAMIGSETVAAFGVATRIESFSAIPMLALSSAIGPMVGQNWGANEKDRVIRSLHLCYGACAVWSALLVGVFWFFGETLAGIFASSPKVGEEAASYLKIIPFSLWGYGIVIVAAGAYNSLGKSVTGLGYYLVRSAVFYVPLSWLASMMSGSEKVYIAIAVSNALAGIVVGVHSLWWLNRADITDCSPSSESGSDSTASEAASEK